MKNDKRVITFVDKTTLKKFRFMVMCYKKYDKLVELDITSDSHPVFNKSYKATVIERRTKKFIEKLTVNTE